MSKFAFDHSLLWIYRAKKLYFFSISFFTLFILFTYPYLFLPHPPSRFFSFLKLCHYFLYLSLTLVCLCLYFYLHHKPFAKLFLFPQLSLSIFVVFLLFLDTTSPILSTSLSFLQLITPSTSIFLYPSFYLKDCKALHSKLELECSSRNSSQKEFFTIFEVWF